MFVAAALAAVYGCAGDVPTSPSMSDCPDMPAEICALQTTSELLSCERDPFYYSRQRDGLLLRIECHVVGMLPARGAEFRRWIGERDDASIVRSLRDDWSIWPLAKCEMTFVVASFSSIQQSFPDNVRVDASMWAHDGVATVAVNPPLAAESVVFSAGECTFEAPHPR
jgi:hypothetical protein